MFKDSLSFDVQSTDYHCPLTLSISVNQELKIELDTVSRPESVIIELEDSVDASQIVVEISMQGKQASHTILDENHNFIRDPRLIFSRWQLSQVPCEFAVHKLSRYRHDCNGTAPLSDNQFSGVMGCNGTVTFSVSTPFLLWLLENT